MINFPYQCPFCKEWVWRPEYLGKRKQCFRCGSENVTHEIVSMLGRRGAFSTKSYLFDLYICRDCNYSELYLKSPKTRKTTKKMKLFPSGKKILGRKPKTPPSKS